MVCAPEIDFQIDREFQENRILPINLTKKLGGGVSANLYEIEIHPTYNQLNTANVASSVSCYSLAQYDAFSDIGSIGVGRSIRE